MDKIKIEAKFLAYKAELEGRVTNRRREVIASELHKLSAQLAENEKTKIYNLNQKHGKKIEEIKSDSEEQILKLIDKMNAFKKETDALREEKRINKIKAQKIFTTLNARLTPDEVKLFKDGLDFIRVFVR
jgi:hypothetical protein